MAGLIVHEWIERSGGAEKVVDEFLKLFPNAALQVLWNDNPERFPDARESWLAKTPLRGHKALSLPFQPMTWRNLRVEREPDWMLASSHLFAHHVSPRNVDRTVPKYAYIHTPARYIWEPQLDRRGAGPVARVGSLFLKPLDKRRAQEPRKFAANSEFTRARIERAWNRTADVIYPPVDIERIISGGDWSSHLGSKDTSLLYGLPREFLLGASRFVPYKRLDLVIEAGEAAGLPVVLAGDGPSRQALQAKADESRIPVHFVRSPSDELLFSLYQKCTAYVFPAIEDFGIMPVEATAAGAPVIVPSLGGAAESLGSSGAGVMINDYTPEGWREAIDRAVRLDRATVRESSRQFGSTRFRNQIEEWMATPSENDSASETCY